MRIDGRSPLNPLRIGQKTRQSKTRQRSHDGDLEFGFGIVRFFREPDDAAENKQCDLRDLYPGANRRKRMGKLVHDY